MKTTVRLLACILGLVLVHQVSAVPITINTSGVVGTASGLAGDNQSGEAAIAQHILDLPASTVNNLFGGRFYNTSSTEYTGSITGLGTEFDGGTLNVPAGYQYAIGKYDGQNAGYILYYLGGVATTLPSSSYSIWGDSEGQYALSHFTAFNATSVPDGGLTIFLLGLAVSALAFFQRRLLL